MLDLAEASALELLFKVLANRTRLRLLHALILSEELCVTQLSRAVEMKPQAVSNQLQRLADRGIVAPRREGNNIHYRIINPCVRTLLGHGMRLMPSNTKRG